MHPKRVQCRHVFFLFGPPSSIRRFRGKATFVNMRKPETRETGAPKTQKGSEPAGHPHPRRECELESCTVWPWIAGHVGFLLSRFEVVQDGKTVHERGKSKSAKVQGMMVAGGTRCVLSTTCPFRKTSMCRLLPCQLCAVCPLLLSFVAPPPAALQSFLIRLAFPPLKVFMGSFFELLF